MAFNINMEEVNDEMKRVKSLLEEVKKEEKRSQDFLENVKYVKYLRKEVAMSKRKTKYNYDEAQKIWNQLKKGTKFNNLNNNILIVHIIT